LETDSAPNDSHREHRWRTSVLHWNPASNLLSFAEIVPPRERCPGEARMRDRSPYVLRNQSFTAIGDSPRHVIFGVQSPKWVIIAPESRGISLPGTKGNCPALPVSDGATGELLSGQVWSWPASGAASGSLDRLLPHGMAVN
jgi:hypothetical protein